ncbi:MAG: antibiotic biosynthesis monooxygenase [Actinobacteria bacterium]|nr:antibiotic biosynthesis monooxygenase [Actinomycetota bacterium]
MSVVVVATITPQPGQHEAVRAALLEAIPAVHAEDGCELYALHEKDDRLVMIEQWSSAEALAVHSKGAALAELGPRLAGKVTAAPEVVVLTAVPAGDPVKGVVVS